MSRESDDGLVCPLCGETVYRDSCACDRKCQACGHARSTHSEEPPYDCWSPDMCDCSGFSYAPVRDEEEGLEEFMREEERHETE